MASANKYFDEIGLSLSKDEAATLAAILAYVGGSPSRSPRGHADSISSALREAGYHFSHGRSAEIHKQILTFEHGSGIQFDDDKPKFVPGYYKYVGQGSEPDSSLHHFGHVSDAGDLESFESNYQRYDIRPAE
jgi:hypothetical protein